MPVNADKPHLWKADIARSVDFYNNWFINFAPQAYRETRAKATEQVEAALERTANLTTIDPSILRANPSVLPILRMATAPPLARDRLIGLAEVAPNLVRAMELEQRIPQRIQAEKLQEELGKIARTIMKLVDKDIFPWLEAKVAPTNEELHRAATVIADRLCGAVADPIVRNAQEKRQLATIQAWLEARGYTKSPSGKGLKFDSMTPGTFAFRLNVPVRLDETSRPINIPIDTVVKPHDAPLDDYPLLIEAKSAGDFTNPNKRRKEEAIKSSQLRRTYEDKVRLILFLSGYFDSGYLGYEAAEGIDWVWEHRVDDLAEFGL